jgi:hypothetical protein
MKKSIAFLLCIAACVGIYYYAAQRSDFKKADGFSLSRVSHGRNYNPLWETRALTPQEKREVDTALSQPYRYFGCGGQSFVFFSADDRYVLKLFKDRYTPPGWLNFIPVPYLFDRYKEKKRHKKADKLKRDFTSYQIAFEELFEHTGVIYIHLNPSSHLKSLKIHDLLNHEHSVDLNSYDFILQKKGELLYPAIQALMQANELTKAEQTIDSLLNFIAFRCQKGVHDRDPNFLTNCGVRGGHAMKIDVGSFIHLESMKDPAIYQSELKRISAPFHEWLAGKYPELCRYFEARVEAMVAKDQPNPLE